MYVASTCQVQYVDYLVFFMHMLENMSMPRTYRDAPQETKWLVEHAKMARFGSLRHFDS